MLYFTVATLLLVLGYFVYGTFTEKVFGASSERRTPAVKYNDGLDFVPLPVWKIFLIQFLNIAGLGPVFGAILGAIYGPVCLLWIVFGSILAGGVHDYMTGMFSVRFKGCTMDYLVGKVLNKHFASLFMIFLVIILILVGAVFALNPAKMLSGITGVNYFICAVVIFGYYFLATLLPIDKIIGRFYPLFAMLLIGVTAALLVCLFKLDHAWFAEPVLTNLHPAKQPIFPLMFITVACGAVSGFHSTQSPIMARCISNEKQGRKVFYGAMILEGFIALVWATLGIAFYQNQELLMEVATKGGQGAVVSQIAHAFLGSLGGKLAVLSVIILAITSGDTAFRSARLTIASFLKINQQDLKKRMILSVLVLGSGIAFTLVDITTLWMYFAWANQTLATITLWAVSVYLKRHNRFYPITLLPAMFMTAVVSTYILFVKIGFNLPLQYAKIGGIIVSLALTVMFFCFAKRKKITVVKEKEEISV